MSHYNDCITILDSLKLKGISISLDEVAKNSKVSHLEFLKTLLDREIEHRTERRMHRNMAGAHFPIFKDMEAFDFSRLEGISEGEINNLLDFRWIDKHENLLFFGPPGLGKTHLSIAFGLKAIQAGYKVCFERITTLVKLLKTMEIQRSSTFRINRIMKADVLIIDEIGYTPIDRKEANLFFSLVSELYERASIIITSNKGFEEWSEMMGDEIMTTALLDRLLHHAHVFSLNGESYRISSKKEK
jgi:DNA replication protein DnaC